MVLTDDNFATIIKAVESGRNIYENIKKAIQFLLSGNFAAILVVIVASLMSLPVPFAPVHLLFINLLTDSLPAIALGLEPYHHDVMGEKPRPVKESILTKDFLTRIGVEGGVFGAVVLAAFLIGYRDGNKVLAGTMAIRLVYLVIGSSIMTLTTTPNQLTDGLERLLRPLNKLHVPVHDIAMMMSIALRFIPILLEETDKIMKAQIARGADFENGNLIQKAKNMVPLLVPLFISAFRRANDLAMAMEARCYHGGDNRTQMKPLTYKKRDHVAYVVLVAYLAVAIGFRAAGI